MRTTPYACHVFVCVNQRPEGRVSCGGSGNQEVRALLKEAVKRRGWEGRVRVSGSLCMGLCAEGPNVVLYPQQVWFSKVGKSDVETIVGKVGDLLESHPGVD